MAVALIVAAGRGERLGSAGPKALVAVAGRPLLEWSVAALEAVGEVTEIVVALPADCLDRAPAGTVGVAGGEVRSASVAAALQRSSPDAGSVIVHDAARPMAAPSLFARVLAELEQTDADAAIAAAPVADTIKEAREDRRTVARTLDRGRLWAVQTPQAFRRSALERALLGASDELLAQATDDAWLVERAGGVVRLVPSGPENLKITTPFDLRLAEALLTR